MILAAGYIAHGAPKAEHELRFWVRQVEVTDALDILGLEDVLDSKLLPFANRNIAGQDRALPE